MDEITPLKSAQEPSFAPIRQNPLTRLFQKFLHKKSSRALLTPSHVSLESRVTLNSSYYEN